MGMFQIIAEIFLVAWISFFPEPVQARYRMYAWAFLGLFLIISIFRRKYLGFIFSFKDWPLWLFLICMLSGTVNAIDKSAAFKSYIYIAATFFLLFYTGKAIFHNEREKKQIIIFICICSCLVAVIGILELYFRKNMLYENFISNPFYERFKINWRPMSTQFNPVILGSYFIGCLPFGFFFLKSKSSNLRLLGASTAILCFLGIIFTFSRGVFLGLVATVLVYFWLSKRRKFLALFLLFLPIFILVCSFHNKNNLDRFGFKRMVFGGYDSIVSEYRLNRINMTLKILKDHPFFGVGFNNFRIRFSEYCDKKNMKEIDEFRTPDNMYLTFLSETGLIGSSGFFIFIIILLKEGLKRINAAQSEAHGLAAIIPISALIGLLVNMAAYELFYWNNAYAFFCLLCGFIRSNKEISSFPVQC